MSDVLFYPKIGSWVYEISFTFMHTLCVFLCLCCYLFYLSICLCFLHTRTKKKQVYYKLQNTLFKWMMLRAMIAIISIQNPLSASYLNHHLFYDWMGKNYQIWNSSKEWHIELNTNTCLNWYTSLRKIWTICNFLKYEICQSRISTR